MNLIDRLLTVVVTATVTSAAWIVVGGSLLKSDVRTADAGPVAKTPGTTEGPAVTLPDAEEGPTLMIPVAGVTADELTDTFSDARGRGERVHEALDIMAPAGTAIVAAAAGTVEKLFRSDAGGNTVYVRSADRRTTHYYAHLRDYAPGLAEGQAVKRGQPLGAVGASGNANPAAPHLHFAVLRTTPDAEWWEPATAIDPLPLLRGPQTGN
ncbi:MAG TPA: M23 family metallopeptidase [Croceibacterium sp.]|nr:M23 family metallopeptidase [Croceibacterium sp.]